MGSHNHPQHLVEIEDGCLNLCKAVDPSCWDELAHYLDDSLCEIEKIHISERFFGLGLGVKSKPSTKQLQSLFNGRILKMPNLRELVIRGAPCSMLSLSLFELLPPRLEILRLQSGITIDHTWSVKKFAKAVENHLCLKELSILNFGVNCQDVKTRRMMQQGPMQQPSSDLFDPLVRSAATVATLEIFHLSCMMAHKPKNEPFITSECLQQFLSCSKLTKLGLTKQGLTDDHLEVLKESLFSQEETVTRLKEILLNDNDCSEKGIMDFLLPVFQSNVAIQVMKVFCQRRLSASACPKLLEALERQPHMKVLDVNVPWSYRNKLDFQLALNRLGGRAALEELRTDVDCIEMLGAVRSDLSALFTVLQSQPHVCSHVSYTPPVEPVAPPLPPMFILTPSSVTNRKGHSYLPPPTPQTSHKKTVLSSDFQTPWVPAEGKRMVIKRDSPCGVVEEMEKLMDFPECASFSSWETSSTPLYATSRY